MQDREKLSPTNLYPSCNQRSQRRGTIAATAAASGREAALPVFLLRNAWILMIIYRPREAPINVTLPVAEAADLGVDSTCLPHASISFWRASSISPLR